jgi:8-oxo-dGTP pyrophosphatase MutT (NUDIX family)
VEPQSAVTHRVVSGVLTARGRVLLCHRRADRAWYPDVWDFAGGHLEAGETTALALARELREELGVEADCSGPVLARWVADDGSEDITFIAVHRWAGEVTNGAPDEHDELGWFTLDKALRLSLPDPRYDALIKTALDGDSPPLEDDVSAD